MSVSRQSVEHVLVVPTELFHDLGHFQGFCDEPEKYLETLLDPAYTSYRPRDAVEEDPSFKQLIPYCIFRFEDRLFHYRRGGDEGEGRLRSKRSIGIGGHISSDDTQAEISAYETGMQREIGEEVIIQTGTQQRCIGLINDDLTEVGKVHLGVVHIFDLEAPKVLPREKSIIQTGFALTEQLIHDRDEFESWSQICLDHLQT